MRQYPENRLNIRMDEEGRITYEQDPVFAKYYNDSDVPSLQNSALEALRERLDEWIAAEPPDLYGDAHDEWELRRADLEDEIEELERETGG